MAIATPTGATGESHGRLNSKAPGAWPLRAAAVLTTSYVASSHADCAGHPSGMFIVTCASVDYTSIETACQGSRDASAWFDLPVRGQLDADAHAQTLANLSAADTVAYQIPVSLAEGVLYARCLIKRTAGTATGTVAVDFYCGCGV